MKIELLITWLMLELNCAEVSSAILVQQAEYNTRLPTHFK